MSVPDNGDEPEVFAPEVVAELIADEESLDEAGRHEEVENDHLCLPLEILRTLHAGSLSRWENRREHEWKLNYAFWAAPAAVIAALLFGKHLDLQNPPPPIDVWIVGLGILAIQIMYLWPVTSRAIEEIELQCQVENAIRKLDPFVQRNVTDDHIGAGMLHRSRWDKGYGRFTPLGPSIVLLFVAGWLIEHQSTIQAPDAGVNAKSAAIQTPPAPSR